MKEYAGVVGIIYFTVPSNTYKVQYKKLIDDLYSLKPDEDEEKGKKNKLISSINIGLLEKTN